MWFGPMRLLFNWRATGGTPTGKGVNKQPWNLIPSILLTRCARKASIPPLDLARPPVRCPRRSLPVVPLARSQSRSRGHLRLSYARPTLSHLVTALTRSPRNCRADDPVGTLIKKLRSSHGVDPKRVTDRFGWQNSVGDWRLRVAAVVVNCALPGVSSISIIIRQRNYSCVLCSYAVAVVATLTKTLGYMCRSEYIVITLQYVFVV